MKTNGPIRNSKTKLRTQGGLRLAVSIFVVFITIAGCVGVKVNNSITTCKEWDEVSATEAREIERFAISAFELVSQGSYTDIWNKFHPEFRETADLQAFSDAMASVRSRLGTRTDFKVEDGWLIDGGGDEVPLRTIVCGSVDEDSDDHRRISIAGRGSEVAAVVLPLELATGSTVGRTASVQMARVAGEWNLTRLDLFANSYNSLEYSDFESAGQRWLDEGRVFPAYVAYLNASSLSAISVHILTGAHIQLKERLEELKGDEHLMSVLSTWTVDGKTYDIVNVGISEASRDVGLRVSYVTKLSLADNAIRPESAELMAFLEQEYPEVFELFNAAVFVAFAERPTDPQKNYPTYTVIHRFDS